MKFFVVAGLLAVASAAPKELFRYESESGDQEHYMNLELVEGVPVYNGGWKFDTEGETRELTYKADHMGFQPEAEYIPVAVKDTNEVAEAKANFRTLYTAHQAKVKKVQEEHGVKKEADVEAVEVARKRRDMAETEDLEDQIAVESTEMKEEDVKKVHKPVYYTYAKNFGYHALPTTYTYHYKYPVPKFVKKTEMKEAEAEEVPYSAKIHKDETMEKEEEELKVLPKQHFFTYPTAAHYPVYYPSRLFTYPTNTQFIIPQAVAPEVSGVGEVENAPVATEQEVTVPEKEVAEKAVEAETVVEAMQDAPAAVATEEETVVAEGTPAVPQQVVQFVQPGFGHYVTPWRYVPGHVYPVYVPAAAPAAPAPMPEGATPDVPEVNEPAAISL